MTEDKRKQGEYEISFASRFLILWCIGIVVGIVGVVVYFY